MSLKRESRAASSRLIRSASVSLKPPALSAHMSASDVGTWAHTLSFACPACSVHLSPHPCLVAFTKSDLAHASSRRQDPRPRPACPHRTCRCIASFRFPCMQVSGFLSHGLARRHVHWRASPQFRCPLEFTFLASWKASEIH